MQVVWLQNAAELLPHLASDDYLCVSKESGLISVFHNSVI